MARKRMSKEESQNWEELYYYVKKLMGYDDNQSLSRDMVLRLKGLSAGKFMANNNVKDNANYSYKIILLTFKYCHSSIQRALSSVSFVDENHKFNYVIKIVESNLNTVYMRMKNAQENKEKTESIPMNVATHSGADYKRKTKDVSSRLKDLW